MLIKGIYSNLRLLSIKIPFQTFTGYTYAKEVAWAGSTFYSLGFFAYQMLGHLSISYPQPKISPSLIRRVVPVEIV